jgi:hypothetical protein
MLNPYPFPLVPYPGLAPELAVRSGMGGWEPYAQAGPADRLLPFVVTRTLDAANSRWLNCARIEHADTEALIATLNPVGYTVTAGNDFDLPFRKYPDAANGVEHFVYFGGIIQALALPCGVPLRLVVDTEWQSPRFHAVPDLSGYLLLEWWDNGPANGVPYGTGFRQRVYVNNGSLRPAEPTTQTETTLNAANGTSRTDSVTKFGNATISVPILPDYLFQAVCAADAAAHFEADGDRQWRVIETKSGDVDADGGRLNVTVSLRTKKPLEFRASCPAPALVDAGYDATADAPRAWRCGDVSDTAPDFQPTGAFACEVVSGSNTGNVTLTTQDINPNSTTVGELGTRAGGVDATRCPVPPTYYSAKVSGETVRNDCPDGQTGASVYYEVAARAFTSQTSQGAADALALAAYNANRQAYANANGTCTPAGGATWEPVFEEMGCFACLMRNSNDASDVRAATAAEAALYFRSTDNNGGPCVECNVNV